MEIKKIHYPFEPDSEGENEWYHFGCGKGAVKISDSQIEEWVNECVRSVKKQLENGVECPYQFQASGNTIVIVFYSQEVPEDVFDDNNYFNVIVAKNYEEGSFFIENLKKKEYKENPTTYDVQQFLNKLTTEDRALLKKVLEEY